jgi:hypothetical protein
MEALDGRSSQMKMKNGASGRPKEEKFQRVAGARAAAALMCRCRTMSYHAIYVVLFRCGQILAVTQPMHRIHTEIMSALLPHQKEALERTASSLACRGKGITACDESAGTIGERFEAVGIANTEENRRRYRQMLFSAPTCEEYLCGAILDPETLTQKSDDGKPFPLFLRDREITTGVKVHLKACVLPGTGGDTVMQGLDSLASR